MAGRPLDLARVYHLTDQQFQAWGRLQKASLAFGASFLARMMRTKEGKDALFLEAIAFVRTFVPTSKPLIIRRKRQTSRPRGAK